MHLHQVRMQMAENWDWCMRMHLQLLCVVEQHSNFLQQPPLAQPAVG
jgi:hypothetical protein